MDNSEQQKETQLEGMSKSPQASAASLSSVFDTSLDDSTVKNNNGINLKDNILSDDNLEEDVSATDTEISSQDSSQHLIGTKINQGIRNNNTETPSDDEDGDPIPSGTVSY